MTAIKGGYAKHACEHKDRAIDTIKATFLTELAAAQTAAEVEQLRVKYLGKKGVLNEVRKNTDMNALSADEKREFGQRFNDLKDLLTADLAARLEQLTAGAAAPVRGKGAIDVTLPGADRAVGSMHPITLAQLELEEIFRGLGFMVLTGYEVEEEFYNFDALNIPADHPARDMQDTYWLESGHVLRTHTSATQVRALKEFGVPLRMVCPGRCFRNEPVDQTHDNTFYQMEGLMVDTHLTVANLIATMKTLLSEVFQRDIKVRLRPGFFPFVEPGFELDALWETADGRSKWLELIPCGMVHPRVLEAGGIDPQKYVGFAFGLGLTRLAMMKFGFDDIRPLLEGDLRVSRQMPTLL